MSRESRDWLQIQRGSAPLIVSLPHTGSTFTLHLPFAQPVVNPNQDSGGDARLHGRLDDPLRAAK